MKESIVVLMCPECSDWWGSSSAALEHLHEESITRRDQDGLVETVGTRADCPGCRARGLSVPREPVAFVRVEALSEIAERVRRHGDRRQ